VAKEANKVEIKDDAWVHTSCGGCYGVCKVIAHRVNGVVVKVDGDPNSDLGAKGGHCPKAEIQIQHLYNPNRINYPVKRTNLRKGLFEDPKWERISWDEAFDTIAEKLKRIRSENPNKLMHGGTPSPGTASNLALGFAPFGSLFGTTNWYIGGAGLHCGNGAHMGAGLYHASWSVVPDYKYCNYAIQMGSNKGTGSGHSLGFNMRLAAEARSRGMKNVVFDPICNFGGGKATEWVPIIPGTDGAVALAMLNVILNELDMYDAEFLAQKTNAPYLFGPDLTYLRDSETGKAMVWDPKAKQAKTWDDTSVKDYVIEGEFEIDGVKYQPGFQLFRNHVKQYTPDWAAEISTVPGATIRRIATEFAEAAQIGSTIEIKGEKVPFRPVAAVMFRGGQGHTNSAHSYCAMCTLNMVVGAMDVAGGCLGWPPVSMGHPETGRFVITPYPDEKDGMLTTGSFMEHAPWPIHQSKVPNDITLKALVTTASFSPAPATSDFQKIWDNLGRPYEIEAAMIYGSNMIRAVQNRQIMADWWATIPFIVSINTIHNEFTEGFADIVLPDAHALESWGLFEHHSPFFTWPIGMEGWDFPIRQPVIEPQYERKQMIEIIWTLAKKIGMWEEMTEYYNVYFSSFGGEALIGGDIESMKGAKGIDKNKIAQLFKKGEEVAYQEFIDRVLKYYFGEKYGVEYLQENGVIRWPKQVKEAYWRWHIPARVPLLMEHLAELKPHVKENSEKIGLKLDMDHFTPLLSWFPAQPSTVDAPDYPLYSFSYRDILHTGSGNTEVPWIDELSKMNPYTYHITMNEDTAKKLGLKSGDLVCQESHTGKKVTGYLKTMQGQHPDTVAIAACSGGWARGQPTSRGKGANFNILLESDFDHACPVCWSVETATRVKVYKIDRRVEYEEGGIQL
jgi:molybdopterin-containing oxidoreductase family molybdopterin binding subunit